LQCASVLLHVCLVFTTSTIPNEDQRSIVYGVHMCSVLKTSHVEQRRVQLVAEASLSYACLRLACFYYLDGVTYLLH